METQLGEYTVGSGGWSLIDGFPEKMFRVSQTGPILWPNSLNEFNSMKSDVMGAETIKSRDWFLSPTGIFILGDEEDTGIIYIDLIKTVTRDETKNSQTIRNWKKRTEAKLWKGKSYEPEN